MSAQPFRAPRGGIRNPLGELLCGYVGRDADNEAGFKALCLQLDPCPVHGAQNIDGYAVPPFTMLREEVPALDLHDQLKDDDRPWSPRSRLTASLGRPALATRLADSLPPHLAAELADRLDTVVTQALTEQQAAITQEISDRYHEARARLDADAAQKLQEVHDERYRRPSRLS